MLSRIDRIFILFSVGLLCLALGCGGGSSSNYTPAYSIGVTVTGLTGTLVLQNNGGDDLTVTSNGTHTFDTELADNAAYSVTASSDPVNQNVTITSGSGTVDEAGVTSITVACADKTWTHPEDQTYYINVDGSSGGHPMVALDGGCNSVIAWYQSDGSNDQTFISEYR